VVERTFGWLMGCRRLVRDYELLPETSETFIYIAMIRIMVRVFVVSCDQLSLLLMPQSRFLLFGMIHLLIALNSTFEVMDLNDFLALNSVYVSVSLLILIPLLK
jgi:hypothetical protein